MKFSLIELSETENNFVKQARLKYGKFYENAEELVFLLFDFFKHPKPDAWIFVSFISQVQKFAILSLLSTIRQHNTQSLMNMRQMFEAGVLAAYALHEKDDNTYYYCDNENCACEKDDIKEKAHKWLEHNYKIHSDTIKKQKKNINKIWTHSNILLTPLNFQLENEEKFLNSFFDKEDEFQTKNNLWFLANSCICLLDLFSKEITKTKTAELVENFNTNIDQYKRNNEELKRLFERNKNH